jgi:hypothetical protein
MVMKKHLLNAGLSVAFLMLTNVVWAFGTVDALTGRVAVINIDGDTRTLSVGERIQTSETIVTGADSEVLIKTDDDGVVFLKPNSKLVVEAYSAKGSEKDIITLRLLKGSFRGANGFIGNNETQHYQVRTPNAVVGLKEADFQVELFDDLGRTNTVTKVNSGEIVLKSRGISLNVAANQFGSAPSNAPPQILDEGPSGTFSHGKLDDKAEQLFKSKSSSNALRFQKNDGGQGNGSLTSSSRIPPNCAGDNPAQRNLDDFISAYERGDIAYIQRRLDPSMIGYGAFLNSMMQDISAQKQIRFLIQNRNAQCGTDLAVINFTWEKRYLDLVTFQPRLQTGQASVLTYLKAGEWRLSGISGDNPFASSLNVSSSLTAIPRSVSFASLPQSCVAAPTSTLSGTATASINVVTAGAPAACAPNNASIVCSIFGFAGTGLSNTVTCSGATVVGVGIPATGSLATSSTGPSSGTSPVTKVIPVTGTAGGQNASGTVTCQANVVFPAGAPVCSVSASSIATQFKLISPSQAGAGSIQIEAIVSNGDHELITLNETTSGIFVGSNLSIAGGAVIPNNGAITINGPTSITFKYTNPTTGAVSTSFFRVTP